MSYLSELSWFKDFEMYDEKTKRVLMLLSERNYKFRNLTTLYEKAEMHSWTLDSIIKNLESRGIVFIRKHASSDKIIVGLRERQDTLPTAMLVYAINGVIQDSFVVEYTKRDTEPLFMDYIKKNIMRSFTKQELDEIMKVGFYRWEENEAVHTINITNTKIIPI